MRRWCRGRLGRSVCAAVVTLLAGSVAVLPARAQRPAGAYDTAEPMQQQQQESRTTALVTGKVMCSDTQRPARFATVMLIGTDQVNNNGNQRGGFGRRLNGRTDLDGNFAMQAEPGDYYVVAMDAGYASLVAETAARLPSGATSADLLRALPQVHVAEGAGGSVNVTIDRGGVIAGKLQWDDGSPATGVNVNAMPASSSSPGIPGDGNAMSDLMRVEGQLGGGFGGGFQNTDDRGNFRISGLAPGTYVLRATVMTPSSDTPRRGMGEAMTAVTFFAPGKVRRSEAQEIALKSGEERDDVLFPLNLAGLHTVSGHVGADSGERVASGMVRLADTQDGAFFRQASVGPDGSFTVQWVPPGSYTLSVSSASNLPPPQFGPRGQRNNDNDNSGRVSFQTFQESVTVTDSDLSGLGISLKAVTASAAAQ